MLACVLLFSVIPAGANNSSAYDGPGEEFLEKQTISNMQYEKLLDNMDSANYGGMYINEDGMLTILVIDNAEVEKAVNETKEAFKSEALVAADKNEVLSELSLKATELTEITDIEEVQYDKEALLMAESQQIIIEQAAYSKEYLDAVQAVLEEYMPELDIKTLGVDPVINSLVVGVPEITDELKAAIINIIGNDDCLSYEKDEGAEFTYTLLNGAEVRSDLGYFSIGVGAKLGGRKGWLTCGHAVVQNQIVYTSGCFATIGKATNVSVGSYGDFAFIDASTGSCSSTNQFAYNYPYLDNDYWGSYDINDNLRMNQGLRTSGYAVVTYVDAYGAVSQKRGGFIKRFNIAGLVKGYAVYNLVEANFTSCEGDSGGPVVMIDQSYGYRSVIGIQSSASGSSSYFTDMASIVENITGTIEGYADRYTSPFA